ncbi:MAG: hypothetical protein C3F13_13385 [Anaerolineales bacterium]|nr:MAG: hypothetical protein C3F13_13385 [Anaerolineales bacterium]
MMINAASKQKLRRSYLAIAIGCGAFVILTLLAMLTYAGGSVDDHSRSGYSLTHSFLSNLGMLTALSGKPNWTSARLFIISLGAAGACLVLFFVIFPRFFRTSRLQQVFSWVGSGLGIVAGICFMGIAFAPADVARSAHVFFVIWAFRLFPLAVLCYLPAMFIDKHYPKVYAWVFTVFCLMLIGYYLLLTNGPSFDSPQGLVIQVVGQKIIAYASIISIFIQSIGAYRFLGSHNPVG